jgi:hypothetical protein
MEKKPMTAQSSGLRGTSEVVVGYFADGADAYRAIDELIDEGFSASDMGAAFRTRRAGERESAAVGEMRGINELTNRNPAFSGSVGGPASGDEAVTPAGLAPGSGNSFAGAPSTPGPIPGAEIPQTLPHDLPETLPHDLPSTLRQTGGADDRWVEHLRGRYGSSTGGGSAETAMNRNTTRASDQKFGTGEGTLGLFPDYEYSESVFEGSFTGMGVGAETARILSGELGRGGAVVTVSAGQRASQAEDILSRNGGRVRFEMGAGSTGRAADRESPVQVYGSMSKYYRSSGEGPSEAQQRKAS